MLGDKLGRRFAGLITHHGLEVGESPWKSGAPVAEKYGLGALYKTNPREAARRALDQFAATQIAAREQVDKYLDDVAREKREQFNRGAIERAIELTQRELDEQHGRGGHARAQAAGEAQKAEQVGRGAHAAGQSMTNALRGDQNRRVDAVLARTRPTDNAQKSDQQARVDDVIERTLTQLQGGGGGR